MIKYEKGDLLLAKVDALVNPVNCVGVMGKGLALQFKTQFPDNYLAYKTACSTYKVAVGKMFVWANPKGKDPQYIINFPTKIHWRNPSQLNYIITGLQDLLVVVNQLDIKSIAIPRLGCGNGSLYWKDVEPLIVNAFVNSNTLVVIYS